MMRKWLKRIFIGISAIAICAIMLIGFAAFELWYDNNYKSHIQTVKIPEKNIQFVLLTDIAGFGDRAWYIYQLPIGAITTKKMKTGHDTEGVLFWNYSEAGDHYDNPKIFILKNKYLVFSRGGLYHSLYDIENNQVVINDESPWASYIQEESTNKSGSFRNDVEMKERMNAWVKKNLHIKIEKILSKAT
jgi:hypothetical protein